VEAALDDTAVLELLEAVTTEVAVGALHVEATLDVLELAKRDPM
jgi:hypothetical protein